MKLKYFVWAYLAIGALVTLFGGDDMHSFAYDIGRGLAWPAVLFPSFGKFLGGLAILGFCVWVALTSKK